MISVINVTDDKKGMKEFIDFPYRLYENDSNWTAPLKTIMKDKFNKKKGAFLSENTAAFFIAVKDGKTVGRVTAQIDRKYNDKYKKTEGFFGFYESVDSSEVCTELTNSVEKWLKSQGMTSASGPFNFNINDECGFQTNGFHREPSIMMPWTKNYYPLIFYEAGWKRLKTLYSFTIDNVTQVPDIINNMSNRIEKSIRNVKIRNINMKKLGYDIETILDIYNDAWSENWGFIPMSKPEIKELTETLKIFADPRIIYLLFKDGEPAACLVAVPNFNEILRKYRNGRISPSLVYDAIRKRKSLTSMRVLIMGVKRKFRNTGLDILLYRHIFETGLKTENYRNVEMGWILENNTRMISLLKKINAKPENRYIILKKDF